MTERPSKPMNAWVYILRRADGSWYVGKTQATLDQRLAQRNAGNFNGYTSRRRPVTPVWQQDFDRYTDANACERQIRGWSQAKKEALIRADYDALKVLAKRRG